MENVSCWSGQGQVQGRSSVPESSATVVLLVFSVFHMFGKEEAFGSSFQMERLPLEVVAAKILSSDLRRDSNDVLYSLRSSIYLHKLSGRKDIFNS